jgi:hypothetical protein
MRFLAGTFISYKRGSLTIGQRRATFPRALKKKSKSEGAAAWLNGGLPARLPESFLFSLIDGFNGSFVSQDSRLSRKPQILSPLSFICFAWKRPPFSMISSFFIACTHGVRVAKNASAQ